MIYNPSRKSEEIISTIHEVKADLERARESRLISQGDENLDYYVSMYHNARKSIRGTLGGAESHFSFFKDIMMKIKLDRTDSVLKLNPFPITVDWDTTVAKIHYLFQMLGVNVVYVVGEEHTVIGEITKSRFLSLRYQTPSL